MTPTTATDEKVDLVDRGFGRMLRILIITAPVVVFLLVLAIVGFGLTAELGRQAESRARDDLLALTEQVKKRVVDAAQVARSIRDNQVRYCLEQGQPLTFVRKPTESMLDVLQTLLEAQAKIDPRAGIDPKEEVGKKPEAKKTPNCSVQGVYIAYDEGDYRDQATNPWYDWRFRGNKKTPGYDFRDPTRPGNKWYVGVRDLRDDEFGVAGPYFDAGGAEMPLVSITLPVRVAGRFVGVAGTDFRVEGLGESIRAVIRHARNARDTGFAFLVGPDPEAAGKMVVFAATEPLERIARDSGQINSAEKLGHSFPPVTDFPLGSKIRDAPNDYLKEFVDRDGRRQLISWEELAIEGAMPLGWKIARAVPYASVWGTYDYVASWCLWGALPGLVVILLLATWLAELALGPIPLLATTAAAVEHGDYNAEALAGVAHRRDEMGQLARGFRKMVGVLADRAADLRRSREELAGRERHFRALIEHSSDLISIIDPSGTLHYRSPSALRILGVDPDESDGHRALDSIHPDDRSRLVGLATGPADDSATVGSVEYRARHRDGSYRVMEGRYADLRHDPDIQGVVLNSRDVTERKANELEIRRLADDLRRERDGLEDRVRVRTAELEQKHDELLAAKEATEQAMKQKDVFLDTVAHDLRMPLAVIIGYSKDLRDQAVEDGLADFTADLNKVIDRSEDLLDLVKDLLQISKSRIGGGVELVLTPFDVGPMLRARLDAVDWLAKNTGNTIEARIDHEIGTMVADKTKLWRILMNLLSNACKFTPRGGRIEVSAARATEDGRDWVVFRVADTGKGMTPEQQSRLFKRFSQVQGTAAEHRDGFGLGLSICLLYCRAMGGRISVESVEGQGSTFTVTLPAIVEPTANAAPPSSRPRADASPRPSIAPAEALTTAGLASPRDGEGLVLIIDDDPLILELMRRNLDEGGFRARAVGDGIEGLRLARELQPSAIVLDVLMPVIDGWAVLAALKSDPATASIPVIMASVLDERQRGLTMGADEYVSKPVHRETLAKLLQKHLDGREAGRLLVVEDDAEARARLGRSLQQQGWEVAEAGDGVEALALMREQRPDLVLLDLFLPTLDGFGVVEAMGKDPDLSPIPVVVLTAGASDAALRSRLGGQVDQVLQKGTFDRKELLRTVRSLVRTRPKRPIPLAPGGSDG